MWHQTVVNKNRAALESSLGFGLVEHSRERVLDFFEETRQIEWDPKTGQPSAALTEDQYRFITNEILFSRLSFDYWRERYCNILTDDKQIIPLHPWPSQKILFDTLAQAELAGKQKVKIILLKSRQIGGTAGSEALIGHLTFLNPNTQAIIAADHPDVSQKLWQTLLRMYDYMPGWMKPRVDARAKATHFHLDRIESDIIVGSGNQKTTLGQGLNVDAAHLTEVSTWEHPEYIDMDLMPAFNSSKKHHSFLILESTGAGALGNWFHDQYKAAVKGTSEFIPLFIAWYMRPGWSRDATGVTFSESTLGMAERVKRETGIALSREQLAFYEIERRDLESRGMLELFFQEYPSTVEEAFQTGFKSAVPIEVRARLRDNCKRPIRVYELKTSTRSLSPVDTDTFIRGSDPDRALGKLLLWELPRAGSTYIVAVDVSYGKDGGDNSSVQVLRAGTRSAGDEQVAEWCGNISPIELATVVEMIGKLYTDKELGLPAMVAVEVNTGNPGIVTQTELIRRGYPHFYRWRRPMKQGAKMTNELGWITNQTTRPLVTEMGVDYLKKGWLQINSPFFVDELTTYVNTEERPGHRRLEHAPGHHDDRIMALFIALYIAHETDRVMMAEERERKAALPPAKRRFPSAAQMGLNWEQYIQKYEEYLESEGL